jgi:DSF synthase
MASVLADASAASRSGDMSAEEVIGAIRQEAGVLPQLDISYEPNIKTVWLTLRPEPKPVFTLDLLNSLNAAQRAIWVLWGKSGNYAASPVRFVVLCGDGPIFTLGGDLDFYLDCLARADRAGLQEYARASVEAVCWSASSLRGAAISLAVVQGKAFGGGIDAPCSCNMVVAESQSVFSYPEVKFNHFPITAVSVLTRRVGRIAAQKILGSAKEFTAAQFEAMGALDAVAPEGEGRNWVRSYAAETLPMHSAKLSLHAAFHEVAGNFEEELRPLARMWTDSMMRLSPMQISRMQRLAQAQERILQFAFAAP